MVLLVQFNKWSGRKGCDSVVLSGDATAALAFDLLWNEKFHDCHLLHDQTPSFFKNRS
jgi:hypothetical protein